MKWSKDWKMEFNPAKTQAIIFTRGRKNPPRGLLELAIQNLPWRSKITYLGLIYNKRLVWHDQMANTIAKARLLLHACYPLLSGKLCLRTKARVYKQLIRPVLTYGTPAWSIASTPQKQKLAVFQNRILRIVIKAPYFVRNTTLRRDLDTEDLLNHIRNLTSGFLDRIRHSKNPTVRVSCTTKFNCDRRPLPADIV
ncbi:hypothetical protein D910_04130 [Dendroctonus ponderosae]|uniref:Reverse transcriptase domain-containing protein n=1 Tax=Dendroctonus ponderosae TaxID=77166 RepID=U4TYL4_DENPD|nr:hypothetical protein D910_04130 [Dendroctonus ponderosae]